MVVVVVALEKAERSVTEAASYVMMMHMLHLFDNSALVGSSDAEERYLMSFAAEGRELILH